jgi:hypothetical protein
LAASVHVTTGLVPARMALQEVNGFWMRGLFTMAARSSKRNGTWKLLL